ncbi:hypothetical protein HN873_062601 [Arachis hypogaea]
MKTRGTIMMLLRCMRLKTTMMKMGLSKMAAEVVVVMMLMVMVVARDESGARDLHTTAKREPISPITLELLLPLSVIDLTPSPPSISHRRRRNELRSHRHYRAALFHHHAATVSALKAPSRSSIPSSPGSPPFSVEQLCSIIADAISVPPVIPSIVPFVNYSIVNDSDNSSKKAVFDEDEEDKYKERNPRNSLKRKESSGGGNSTLEELIREEEKKKEKINRRLLIA